MYKKDAQKIWEDYYQRKKEERLKEAKELNKALKAENVFNDESLIIDFVCFGKLKENIQSLKDQLSENYKINIEPSPTEDDYWYARGTTKPYGVKLDKDNHLEWIVFMCDVARSYNCVFSTWTIESLSLGIKFKSEDIET